MKQVDFYFSFRSHYCYLALRRVHGIEADFKIRIEVRPVLPLAIRSPEFFAAQPKDPRHWRYVQADAERIADMLQLPFGWPSPDPVTMNGRTLEAAPEQPYIHRLTHLAVAAVRRGRGLEFTSELAGQIWGGQPGWDHYDRMADAAARAGLNIDEMNEDIDASPNSYADEVCRNQESLDAAGHWGVPTLVFDNEPFFGQDRIDLCRWRLEQAGLAR